MLAEQGYSDLTILLIPTFTISHDSLGKSLINRRLTALLFGQPREGMGTLWLPEQSCLSVVSTLQVEQTQLIAVLMPFQSSRQQVS